MAENHPVTAGVAYVLCVTVVIGLTVPGATTLSFAGGMLFPQPRAAVLAYLGFVAGALLSFWMVKTLLFDWASTVLGKLNSFRSLEGKLKKNAFAYLVAARFTLVFPFWLVNSAAALVGVPFRTFALATALSVIPGSVIYTTAGRALVTILDESQKFANVSLSDVLLDTLKSTEIQVCLALVVVAATLPSLLSLTA
jgi:uncharacterized membrane protein YdjX (TVP38/TMEM64 family)